MPQILVCHRSYMSLRYLYRERKIFQEQLRGNRISQNAQVDIIMHFDSSYCICFYISGISTLKIAHAPKFVAFGLTGFL